MLKAIAVACCLVANASEPMAGQVAKIIPVDEATADPEFFLFRARLIVALQKRDVDFLYGILSPNILNSFGGEGGIDEFKTTWKPEDPASEVWRTLTEVLVLGGQFHPPTEWSEGSKTFVAPYTFAVRPTAGHDPFRFGVIVGDAVRVRERPNRTSAILATLSFDVIRVTDWKPTSESDQAGATSWVAVELADGRSGYVASDFVRSRIGYRAIFMIRDGRWVLRALVAGD